VFAVNRDVLPRLFRLQVKSAFISLRVVGSSLTTRHSVVCLSVVVPEFVVVVGGLRESSNAVSCVWCLHIAVCRNVIVVENTIILITK